MFDPRQILEQFINDDIIVSFTVSEVASGAVRLTNYNTCGFDL